jgi:hypothetical protein
MGQHPTFCSHAGGIPADLQAGLRKLLEAYRYATDVARDLWDFAVEIRALRAAGLTTSDLRWLICKGYVEHRVELHRPDDDQRRFRGASGLKFYKHSCFVLTPAGAKVAGQAPGPDAEQNHYQATPNHNQNGDGRAKPVVPEWDPIRHELKVGGEIVKQFKLPSPNQETILTVFQEEGWPLRIDDPLPQRPGVDPKERLHNTIRALNRHQRHRLLRIKGDGTGEGVLWEIIHGGEPQAH